MVRSKDGWVAEQKQIYSRVFACTTFAVAIAVDRVVQDMKSARAMGQRQDKTRRACAAVANVNWTV